MSSINTSIETESDNTNINTKEKLYNIKKEFEIEIPIEKRDYYLEKIEELIKDKKETLLKNRKLLEDTSNQNVFLDGVKKDYQNYFETIIDEKRKQSDAFTTLNSYLKMIEKTGKLTEREIQNSKNDQIKILKEMDKIKRSLDELIQTPI